jgi:hypothetical protein
MSPWRRQGVTNSRSGVGRRGALRHSSYRAGHFSGGKQANDQVDLA